MTTAPSFWKNFALGLLALFVLNAFMSMTNLWPTPFVQLDKRLAPEFVLLWVVILLLVRVFGLLSRKWLTALTLAYMVLVLGRYFDTTAPALFGRDINLYWDTLQIPRVVWVSLKSYPLWVAALVVASVVALFVGVFFALRTAIAAAARYAAPTALKSGWAWAITLAAVVLVSANVYGVRETWPYVSKPAIPTYWRQAKLLAKTYAERNQQKTLPASPAFDSDLAALRLADVNLFLFESYGKMVFTNSKVYQQLKPAREALAKQIATSGMQVLSAYVNSTTFGGGSELAQLSLLSGIDTADPLVHDLLLTTQRPTLAQQFRKRGYETFALYPGLSWDWPEKSFYDFQYFLDARDLGYKGPKLGYWTVPDQFSLARFDQLHPITAQSPKRFLFFPSITSHMPFHPVPPYLPDWKQILSAQPFTDAQMAAVNAQKEDWFNMLPAYTGMIEYDYLWFAGYLAQPKVREAVYVVMGDHQPAANVTGEGASWEVPVHIISANPQLLERFAARGFKPGLEPSEPSIGKLFDLTRMLVDVFDSTDGKTKTPLNAAQNGAGALAPKTLP